jgi:hypothetical protein
MDIGSLFLIFALFILVAMFVARPIINHTDRSVSEEEQALSALMAERDQVLDALYELDMDYQLGKIPEEDYPAQRNMLLQRGAETLERFDKIQKQDGVETAIAARRVAMQKKANGQQPRRVTGDPDDQLEALIANRRREKNEKTGGFCPQCGRPVQMSDKFCSACGHTLRD